MCLIISFVVSSHVLMSSARIPFLSLALPFLKLPMAACISFRVNSVISCLTSSWKLFFSVFLLLFQVLRVLYFFFEVVFSIWIAVEFIDDIYNPFSRCDCTTFVVFNFWNKHSLLRLFFLQDMFLIPLNFSKIRCIFLYFWFFLFLMHFLICLLSSFKWCFSPLAIVLLS